MHPLGQRHPLRAFNNWIAWQIRSRILPGPHVVDFVGQTRLQVTRSMHGATGNIYCGLHEFEDMAFAMHLLREGDLFVDVGANIGSYSILASGVCGAETVAIEPSPEAADALQANVDLNGLNDKVHIWRCAVGAQTGTVRLTQGFDCVNRVVDGAGEELSIEVPQQTLDELLNGEPPTLLKIDVEGYEHAVLRGATATVAHPDLLAVIVEANGSGRRYGVGDDAVFRLLEAAGLRRAAYNPLTRRVSTETPHDRTTANVLFVRDLRKVQARVSIAPRRSILGQSL